MDNPQQIELVIKEYIPEESLNKEQRTLIEQTIPDLVSALLEINIPTFSNIFQIVIQSALLNILNTFNVDFTDVNQLIEEILKKLREKNKK